MASTANEILAIARTQHLAIGDQVKVRNLQGVFTVEDTSDAGLIGLRSECGAYLRVGRLRVRPVGGAAAAVTSAEQDAARRSYAGQAKNKLCPPKAGW